MQIKKARTAVDLLELLVRRDSKKFLQDNYEEFVERAESILENDEPYTAIHQGSLLHTKDGRKQGNAIVWEVIVDGLGLCYECVSDFGNVFKMRHKEIVSAFFVGETANRHRWLSDRKSLMQHTPRLEEPFLTTNHFHGKDLPLSAVLFALASQEGNDGDEGNAMQAAGEFIRKVFPENVIFALEVGHYAEPATGEAELACGYGRYSRAVVVSIDPFVMVSEHGDMVWTQQQAENFKRGVVPTDEVLEKVRDRLRRNPEIGVDL